MAASSALLPPQVVAAMKAQIEKERAKLLASKDMAETDRDHFQKDLEHKENELKHAQEQQTILEHKLKDLESKVSSYFQSISR